MVKFRNTDNYEIWVNIDMIAAAVLPTHQLVLSIGEGLLYHVHPDDWDRVLEQVKMYWIR